MKHLIFTFLLFVVNFGYSQFEVIEEDTQGLYYSSEFTDNNDSLIRIGNINNQDVIIKSDLTLTNSREIYLPSTPVVIKRYQDELTILCSNGEIFKSLDEFITYSNIPNNLSFLIDQIDYLQVNYSTSLICANDNGSGIMFRSNNYGVSYINQGFGNAGGQRLIMENDTIYCVKSGGAFVSIDYGLNWYVDFYPIQANEWYYDMYKDSSSIILVGQGYDPGMALNYGAIVISKDFGDTWLSHKIYDMNFFRSIFMVDNLVGYSAGRSQGQPNNIYKTFDGGVNWVQTSYNTLPTTTIQYLDITCMSHDTCVVCGGFKALSITTNGGGVYSSIKESKAHSLKIYPNPSASIFNIESENTIQSYQVLDQLGKVVMSKEVNEKHIQVDLTGYSRGLYFVKIVSEGYEVTKKLVME
jgi:hypothetical protein